MGGGGRRGRQRRPGRSKRTGKGGKHKGKAVKKAKWSNEKTRSQIQCRRSDGTCFAIKYGKNGKSMARAIKEAEAWLKTA